MAAKYVPEPEEAEELILDAIRKITSAKSKQRATSEKICSALLRSHGLEESTTMLQITMMLATNKIENKPKNGLESLKIVESSAQSLKKPGNLSKEEDRLSDSSGSETESEESIPDSVENMVESPEETNMEENMVESPEEINTRLLVIEKQVAEILKRIAEKDVKRTSTDSSQKKETPRNVVQDINFGGRKQIFT